MDISMEEWPTSRPNPHLKEDRILADPPLPMDAFFKPVRITDTGRLFQKSFWETDAAKFGHRSLRLGVDDLGLVSMQRNFFPERERVKHIGPTRSLLLDESMAKLQRAGYTVVAMYLREYIKAALAPILMRKRMHEQVKLWPTRDGEVQRLWTVCTNESNGLLRCYQLSNASDEEKKQRLRGVAIAMQLASLTLDEYKNRLSDEVATATERFLFACIDLHRFMIVQIQQTQHLVVEYLQLEAPYRASIYKRYISFVHNRLEVTYEEAACKVVEMIKQSCGVLQPLGAISAEMVRVFADLVNKLETDQKHFEHVRQYMTEAQSVATGNLSSTFSSVPQAAYRRRYVRLEALAFRELKFMPTGIRQMFERCLEIFQVKVPPEEANAKLDPALAALLATAPPVLPTAGQPNWLSPQNQPNPTTVTNMGTTALPHVSPQLYTALGLQPNPQPLPPPTFRK